MKATHGCPCHCSVKSATGDVFPKSTLEYSLDRWVQWVTWNGSFSLTPQEEGQNGHAEQKRNDKKGDSSSEAIDFFFFFFRVSKLPECPRSENNAGVGFKRLSLA